MIFIKKSSAMKILHLCSYLFFANWGTTQAHFTVLTATGNNLSNPFATEFHDLRYQYILNTTELTNAGLSVNRVLSSISFDVTTAQSSVMHGLTISIKHTTANTISTFDNTGFTQVYTGNFATLTTGWREIQFQNNFIWNGTSNVLIQLCFDNTTSSSNSLVSFRNTGSNRAVFHRTNSAIGCSLNTPTTSQNVPITRFFATPILTPNLQDYAADANLSTSFAHRRSASIRPKFTISSNTDFNAVQIEMNHLANFTGTALISTIIDGNNYIGNTPYDFWTTQDLTGDRTYFVRARVSNNGGSTWGAWTTQFWPYSYYPNTSYPKEGWYFTTQEQFQLGTVNELNYNFINIHDNSTVYPDDDYFLLNEGTFTIHSQINDGVREGSSWFNSQTFMTMGRRTNNPNCSQTGNFWNGYNFITPIPNGAVINSADFSVVASGGCPCNNSSATLQMIFDAHAADNGPALNVTSVADLTNRTTANQTITYTTSTAWSNGTRYNLLSVANIIQEIVNRTGWQDGNSFNLLARWNSAFTPTGTHNRCLASHEAGITNAPRIDGTFTNFFNTVRFPAVNKNMYGPATNWDELIIDDNTVGCGSCYTAYRIHDASNNNVLAGPFVRQAGFSGIEAFDISSVTAQEIYVSARIFRNNSPEIHSLWLTTDAIAPLPVEWGGLQVHCNDVGNHIQWETESEINNHYFEVLKSNDGKNWKTICQVNGAGNSTLKRKYDCTDFNRTEHTVYYKIKQVDFDGTSNYSEIVSLNCQPEIDIQIIPNPNNGNFRVVGTSVGDLVNIYDTFGKLTHQEILKSDNSEFRKGQLASGIYVMHIKTKDDKMKFIRFVIQ